MVTEYELYSDERYVRHAEHRYLFLGGLICTDSGRDRLVRSIRSPQSPYAEMRWSKISKSYLNEYCRWADVFFDDPFARFVILQVDKSSSNYQAFRREKKSRDAAKQSVFYQFLMVAFCPLRDTKRWWVFPDAGFFSRDRVVETVEYLLNTTYKKAYGQNTSRTIRLARARDSRNTDLIQLADILLGAFSCWVLGIDPVSQAKRDFMHHCRSSYDRASATRKGIARVHVIQWAPEDKFVYPQALPKPHANPNSVPNFELPRPAGA